MNLYEQTEREINIFYKLHENDDGFIYDKMCIDAAFNVLKAIFDTHPTNDAIWGIMHYLKRMISNKPLSPITDKEDTWRCIEEVYEPDCTAAVYQNLRMSSLFKYKCLDGAIKYYDFDRFVFTNIENGISYYNGFLSNTLHNMDPIILPYYPKDTPTRVMVEKFLYDPNRGDFDTIGLLYSLDDIGNSTDIYKYYGEDEDGDIVEISEKKYLDRRKVAIESGRYTANIPEERVVRGH